MGFELTVPKGTADFETTRFVRSGIAPDGRTYCGPALQFAETSKVVVTATNSGGSTQATSNIASTAS